MDKRYFFLAAIMLVVSLTAVDAQTRRASRHSRPTKKVSAVRPAVLSSGKKVVAVKPAVLSSGAVKTASGLVYLITKNGTGPLAKPGQTVSVHYTGTLTDGTKFDSSRDRGQPIDFPLGAGRVIKGWDEGISKMHVGDQAILVIPSAIAYGPKGRGPIPPDATLIFVVELVGIKDGQ